MESESDPEVEESPDVWELFRHYDKLYFRGELDDAAFAVEWASPRLKTSSGFGSCSFGKMGKTITLYQPMLQHRTKADLKNSLLHLMIHAIIFVKHGMKCLRHGPVFRDWMDAINACSIKDYLRPKGGYCVTTTHDFSPEDFQSIQGNLWKCKLCAATLLRATKLGPPSDSCCIENPQDGLRWYICVASETRSKDGSESQFYVPVSAVDVSSLCKHNSSKRRLLTETSETSKSQDAVQESDSDEVQKAIVPATPWRKLKLKQEFVASEKHELSSIGSRNNAKSLGSCSSKKAEDFRKAIVLSASPLSKLKRKQISVSSEKHELRSVESFYNAKSSRSDTSRKASKWHKQEHVQKSNVQPAASQKKLKLEEDLTLAEKYGVFSLGSCNNAKLAGSSTSRKASKWHKPEAVEKSSAALATPVKKLKLEKDLVDKHGDTKPLKKLKLEKDLVDKHRDTKPLGGSTGNKEGKLHKPEGIQKASVLPASPSRKLKQDLVASEKNELSSFAGRSNANVLDSISSKNAHKQRENEETQKPIARPAAPQSIQKQQNKTNSSVKAGKQHSPEDFQKTFVQSAVFQSKLKKSNRVAPERQRTSSVAPERQKARSVAPQRKKTRSVAPGKKKEYACVSVWANIYESECSSGSAEPLVNKRTERRKRERERTVQIAYSRSRKRIASGICSIKAQPAEEEVSSHQGKPPPQSQCLEFILIDAADEVVTQDPRGTSQAPAPCLDIVVPPADKVKTQTPRGQSQLPAQCMGIDIPPANLVVTRTHGDPPVQSTCMDIVTVPPADHVTTQAHVHQPQPQPPAPCSIATDQVVPPHSADPPNLTLSNPSSNNPDVIDISDDD